jgi:hypothetical protein
MRTGLLVLLLAVETAVAAFDRAGNLSPGPSGTSVASSGAVWAPFTNPAALASLTSRTLALSHVPRPFGLPDLARSALAYVEPLSFGTVAVTVQRYGCPLYRELTAGMQFGTLIEENWSAGVGVNLFSVVIAGYGSAVTAGIDAGLAVDFTDDLRAGIAALNVNAPSIGRARERLPQMLTIGLCYRPMDGVALTGDVVKDLRYPPDFIAAVEIAPVKMVRFSAGSGTEPSLFRAGVEVAYSFVEAGYVYTSHPDLGGTHQFSLVLSLSMF